MAQPIQVSQPILSNSSAEPATNLKNQVLSEALQQTRECSQLAHDSFRLALVVSTVSAFIMLVGVGLLMANHTSEGTVTTAGGLVSGVGILQLSKEASDRRQEANERLDKLTETLKASS
ncbi:hypothetical protein [Trichocoleus sp. FACHB-591]|uniref:TRADD-N-associated membrane domain-containing protein n=1 Tax=Trichocoleus sp. FACHB-591 TaxID=2692872 RepID=UPI0018EFB356|nr:hypothetical protein [Trichocoleus sp. FACHB-591]